MESLLTLVSTSISQVLLTLQHNWPYLLVSVLIAVALKLYVDADKVSAFLTRYKGASVVTATAAAVATPLCSCGTTAVILGMLASRMTWAPIVAFMVSSPLTSPEGVVYSAGLFGWPFAWAFYLASIVLGLAGGWIAALLESRGWLANQARFADPVPAPSASLPSRSFGMEAAGVKLSEPAPAASDQPAGSCSCSSSGKAAPSTTAAPAVPAAKPRVTPLVFLSEVYNSGVRLLGMFLAFAFIGYFLNGLIPAEWVAAIFGSGNVYSVPLAATLGLPLYINSEASLPLVRALLDHGMSQGAALAFLISGAGTSIGAITGALTIARWRVVGLVVGILWAGAILTGFAFDLLLRLNLF